MSTYDYNAAAEVPVDITDHDKLGLEAYSKSLVKYITDSVTPTTIAIQGDWGCGKTSLLNIVRSDIEKLNESCEEKYISITFNTWQYSQFEMADSLTISFMTHFLSELKTACGESEKVESTLSTLGKISFGIMKNVAVYTAGKIGGDEAKELLQGTIDSVENGFEGEDVIETLKEQIDACIDEIFQNCKAQRIIVFIDDLDRLNPEKAVELMEIIKIFMDKKGCVYVLAVDTDVVKHGIVKKYGLNEEKSQAFFDKLIQLPFLMPISYYDFSSYVQSIFQEEGKFDYCNSFWEQLVENESDKKSCISLMQMVSARNPRAVKRAINAFILQELVWQNKKTLIENKIVDNKIVDNTKERFATAKILLALTCIQLKLVPDYNIILKMIELSDVFIKWIKNKDKIIEVQDFELMQKYNYSEEQIKKYNRDKVVCGEMIKIFKNWCMDYIRLRNDDGTALLDMLKATNGVVEEQGKDYVPLAKIILNEFEKRLKEYRKEIIWKCLEEEKEAGTYELWYDEAVEVWDVSKKTQTNLSHQKMLDNIVELTRALRMAGQDVEIGNRIMDFYNEIESPKFKFAYSKIVRENFKNVIGENLTTRYKWLKKYEAEIKEELLVTEVFHSELGIQEGNWNASLVNGYLEKWIRGKLEKTFEDNCLLEDMFDEIWERVEYAISKMLYRNISGGGK